MFSIKLTEPSLGLPRLARVAWLVGEWKPFTFRVDDAQCTPESHSGEIREVLWN